jgi:glycosyltransferase involved in cell wall biosynthesis
MAGDPTRTIVFDATPLEVRHASGVTRYTHELLRALVAVPRDWRIVLASSRPLPPDLLSGTAGRLRATFPNRWLWMQAVLPPALARARPALCHFTNYLAPIRCPVPYVLTIHDLSAIRYPETQTPRNRLLVGSLLRAVARRACAIATLSEVTRRDIVEHLGVAPERVHVLGGAPCELAAPGAGADEQEILNRLGVAPPFVLAVGTIEPRKNLPRLVEAFARIRERGRPERLVLAGAAGWKYGPLLDQVARDRLQDAVVITGYLPGAELGALYRHATLLAFPSLYEGLGLPALEALAWGTPLVTSRGTAMEEFAGDAAVYVDPTDVGSIAAALERVLADSALRLTLRQRGLERARRFDWPLVAQRLAAVYDRVLAGLVGT